MISNVKTALQKHLEELLVEVRKTQAAMSALDGDGVVPVKASQLSNGAGYISVTDRVLHALQGGGWHKVKDVSVSGISNIAIAGVLAHGFARGALLRRGRKMRYEYKLRERGARKVRGVAKTRARRGAAIEAAKQSLAGGEWKKFHDISTGTAGATLLDRLVAKGQAEVRGERGNREWRLRPASDAA